MESSWAGPSRRRRSRSVRARADEETSASASSRAWSAQAGWSGGSVSAAGPSAARGRARGEALQAVAVERAGARETVRRRAGCGCRPISGCTRPCSGRPSTRPPPPMPVPTVRYRRVEPRAAPQRCSPSAAAFTSVSKRHRDAERAASRPGRVDVRPARLRRRRHVAVGGRRGPRSTGPNEPMPMAATGPCGAKKATTAAIVSSGDVVGSGLVVQVVGPAADRAHTSSRPPRRRRKTFSGRKVAPARRAER